MSQSNQATKKNLRNPRINRKLPMRTCAMPKVFKLQEDSIAAITSAMSVVQPAKDFTERGKQKNEAPSNFVLEDRAKTYQSSFLRARRPLSKKLADKLCSFYDAIYGAGELDIETHFPDDDLPLLSELLQAYLVARREVPDFVRDRCEEIANKTTTQKSNGGLKKEFFCVVGPVDTDPLEDDNGGEAIFQTAFPMTHAKQLKELDELSQQVYNVSLSTLTAPYLFLVNNVDKSPSDIRALLGLGNEASQKRASPNDDGQEKGTKLRKAKATATTTTTKDAPNLGQNLVRAIQAKKLEGQKKSEIVDGKSTTSPNPHGTVTKDKEGNFPVTPEGETVSQKTTGHASQVFGHVQYAQPTFAVPIQYMQPPTHPQYLPVQHSYPHPYAQAQPTYSVMGTHYPPAAYAQVQPQQTPQYVSTYPSTLAHPNLDHTSGGNHMNGGNGQHRM